MRHVTVGAIESSQTHMTSSAELTRRIPVLGALALSLLLSGCGVSSLGTATSSSAPLVLSGSVHGGVQPITGAAIQLYAVGTTGNGSQATGLLASPVFTDSQSYFNITGDYTCPSPTAQVYLIARGGNPGLPGNANNPALVLMSALGNCGDLQNSPTRFISLNEVSTVGAVYAMAQFMTGADHVGASATNLSGMTNAFLNARLLVDPATGMAPRLPSNLRTETDKLYALADAIVPCVNSDGGNSCSPLFTAATAPGGTAPTDVVSALLNIVKNPGRNVAAVFSAIGSTPPFPTGLTVTPHDWTMSLKVTGGGLAEPTQLALDKAGNIWVTNYGHASPAGLVAFSPQGTPLPGSPFGPGLQTDSYGLTVDKNNDIWVVSADNVSSGSTVGSVAKFAGISQAQPGTLLGQYYDSTLYYPESIASDPSGSGRILIGNYVGGTVTFYDLNGNFQNNLGAGVPVFPVSVTSDNAGGAWLGDQGDHNIVHVLANGAVQQVACCVGVPTVSLDPLGNVWASNFFGVGIPPQYTFSEVAPSGAVLIYEASGGGLYSPGGAFVDAGGQFWVANYYGSARSPSGTITEIAGNSNAAPAGTPLTPSTGLGADAGMQLAYSLAPDASGNIWVVARNGNALFEFFGLATPTQTPATPIPQVP